MFRKKFGREKAAKIFSSKNESALPKLKSREFAKALTVHNVSELMHAWFTLKGKVKKIRRCPVNQLKLFCAIGIM